MGDSWFFDWFAPLYDRLMWSADAEPIAEGFDHAAIDVDRVLDVAGGSGRIARELAAGYDVTVLDLSRPMLEEARGYGLECVQGDVTRMPVPSGAVDAVVIADAYHHFPDPGAAARDVFRVLAHGGILVVRDFDPSTLRGRAIHLGERVLGWPCTFRTPGALAEELESCGFEARVLHEGFGYTVVGRKPETDG